MKNITYKPIFFFLSLFWVGTICWAQSGENEISKTLTERYDVSANDELEITNKYGEVHVNTWDKSEITIDITIRAWGRSEQDAKKLLERIEIEKNRFDNKIYFKTEVSSGNINISRRSGFEINYKVNMPKGNPLNLENKYGSVYLDDFEGSLQLEVGYGKLKAKRITGKRSEVKISYGSAEIDEFRDGKLESKYSKPISIELAGDLELEDKYGGVEIGEITTLIGSSAYSGLEIGILHKALDMESKYGSGKVKTVKAGFDEIDVESSYGSFQFGFESDAAFDFDIETKYGSFDYGMDLNVKKQIEKNYTSNEYAGYYKSPGNGRVKVSSSYGKVKFF